MVMLAGTAAMNDISLDRVTVAPPAGAGPLNVTVPVERPPAMTELGFSDSEDNATAWLMVNDAVLLTPL